MSRHLAAAAAGKRAASRCRGTLSPAVPLPDPPPVAAPDFSAVHSRVDQFPSANVAVMVGNRTDTLLRYQRGSMTTTRPVFIASASKLLLGATALLMIEDHRLAADAPVSGLVDFWSQAPSDSRSAVTFEQLFAFTSGLNGTAEQQQGCIFVGGPIGEGGAEAKDVVRFAHLAHHLEQRHVGHRLAHTPGNTTSLSRIRRASAFANTARASSDSGTTCALLRFMCGCKQTGAVICRLIRADYPRKSGIFMGFCESLRKRKVVAGLESNHQNNTLISILFLGSAKSFPHIFVNLTAVRFFVRGESLENKRSAERQADAFPARAI